MQRSTLVLVHWDAGQREERAGELRSLGFDVSTDVPAGSKFFHYLEQVNPAAIIIDLTRIPSQGRDLGVAIRKRKGTRTFPLVFAGGDPVKVRKIEELLPDAQYCDWNKIEDAVLAALELDADEVAVPDSVFAAYAGKPVVEKLGIGDAAQAALVDAPDQIRTVLTPLPEGASIEASLSDEPDLVVWFTRSFAGLEGKLERIVEASKRSPVWIAWPKKSSGMGSDLTQTKVRKVCMDAGMVDYKVCSIDATWTALLFTFRGT